MKKALKTILTFFLALISIVMIISDRFFRIYRIKDEQPGIEDLKVFEFYRKDVIRRTKIRLLLITIACALYSIYKLLTQ